MDLPPALEYALSAAEFECLAGGCLHTIMLSVRTITSFESHPETETGEGRDIMASR